MITLARPLLAALLLIPIGLGTWQDPPEKAVEPANEKPAAAGIAWRTDRAAALQESRKLGKPVLYYFRCDP